MKPPKPLSLGDLKSLIAEVYLKKIESNYFNMLLLPNQRKIENFDEFFYNFMLSKYKLKVITENEISSILGALLNHTGKSIIIILKMTR